MGGALRIAIFPLMAGAVFALGCGVPIAPEYVAATSTAQAVEQRANTDAQLAGQDGLELRSASTGLVGAQSVETTPLPTREATITDDNEDPEATATAVATIEATAMPALTPATVASSPPAPVSSESFTQEFVSLLNALRSGRGLGSLTLNGSMTSAANSYAGYMGSANFFGHFGPDGSAPRSRLTAAGYRGSYKGEALSAGQATPQSALNALLASPPHAAILLEPSAVEIGVGYALQPGSTYTHYWVVITGIP